MLRKLSYYALGCLIISLTFVFSRPNDTSAAASCTDYRLVGVRGSGQILNESDELIKLKSATLANVPSGVQFEELDNNIAILSGEEHLTG